MKNRKRITTLTAAIMAVALHGGISYAGDAGPEDGMTQGEETALGLESAVSRTGQAIDDVTITSTVKMRLIEAEHVDADAINVDTSGSVVTLTGTVGSADEKERAGKLAADVEGVSSVDNRLTVGTEPSMAAKAAGTVDDAAITAKVKARLIDEDSLSAAGINVDTANKVVTLSGSVVSMHDRQLAEDIAAATEGVDHVDNRLLVKTGN